MADARYRDDLHVPRPITHFNDATAFTAVRTVCERGLHEGSVSQITARYRIFEELQVDRTVWVHPDEAGTP
jgi:hypothetical protein